MLSNIQNTSYYFDFRDALRILKENPNFVLSNSQYEDIVYFVCEEMRLDINKTLEVIQTWGYDKNNLSSNFHALSELELDKIRDAITELCVRLWRDFNNKNMFDPLNNDNLTFPFILEGMIGSNLIFMKDNVISSNEINPFG